MLSKAQIKTIRSLREKKFREELGLFVVEGDKMVQEALASGFEVVQVLRESEEGAPTMERLSSFSSPPPSIAVVKIPENQQVDTVSDGLCLALDGVRDPGNMGTIIRLADWFGVSAIYASEDCVELYNPKVVQATMGAIFRKKVIYCDLKSLCEKFQKAGRQVIGTFLEGENIYSSEIPSDPLIVMGNEANGISPAVARLVSRKINIPSFDSAAESLNVAIATAITVSEVRRRSL